jgi:hypothetical protein
MKAFNKWCCLALLIATIPISSAQQQERGRFAQREGYEQADFGSQVLTIKTASGTRSPSCAWSRTARPPRSGFPQKERRWYSTRREGHMSVSPENASTRSKANGSGLPCLPICELESMTIPGFSI